MKGKLSLVMDGSHFLESSSIHGLAYISTTRKLVKIFWMFVVFIGFSGAGILIHQSFQAWDDSPVTTTIETLPIKEMTFPKVTVCPPKSTYTILNYDLMMIQNMTVEADIRVELANLAVELVLEAFHNESMKHFYELQDEKRYHNWYHGYTEIYPPFYHNARYDPLYYIKTYATSGSISSLNFNETFEAAKINTKIYSQINLKIPEKLRTNQNVSFHLNIEKISVKDLNDQSQIRSSNQRFQEMLNQDSRQIYREFTPPGDDKELLFTRHSEMITKRVEDLNLTSMPGFKVSWHYNGKVEQLNYYHKNIYTRAFVRKGFLKS